MLPRNWMEAYINFLLKFRWWVIGVVLLVTIYLGFYATQMRVYTNFFDLYPPGIPISNFINSTVGCLGRQTSSC